MSSKRFFWGAWTVNGVSVKVYSSGQMSGGFSVVVGGTLLSGYRTGSLAKAAGFAAAAAKGGA